MMRWTGTAAPTMQVCSFLVIYDIYLPTLLLDCFCQVTYGEARARARIAHTRIRTLRGAPPTTSPTRRRRRGQQLRVFLICCRLHRENG